MSTQVSRRYYLEAAPRSSSPHVLFSVFVKTSGDTLGVVDVLEDGFAFWRDGSCIGTFDTMKDVFKRCARSSW